ncbi:aldo/keto reductase [Sediminibacterium sp.]|uniref:aldo/keto reductase n=1 Tax=Sediminibacterium sp. TaxID=1917865 RepID=UPI003F6A1229
MENNMILSSPVAGCMRWGKWGANFSTYDYRQLIDQCLSIGVNSFDHADIYGDYTTEEEFGEALKEDKTIRPQIKLITKCGIQMVTENRPEHNIKSYNTSKKHIIRSAEQSLKNFGTDYLDVLLIHRPDPLLDPAEVAEAIQSLQIQGKVRSFGVSNFLPHQVNMLRKWVQIDYNQIEVSIIRTSPFSNGILDNCIENNIVPMAWAPLGGGLLTDDLHPHFRSISHAAHLLSEKYAMGLNEMLIAWLNTHPAGILPVIGTTKAERLEQAKKAASIKLTREDWFLLMKAAMGEDVA